MSHVLDITAVIIWTTDFIGWVSVRDQKIMGRLYRGNPGKSIKDMVG